MKGNDGRGAKNQLFKKFGITCSILVLFLTIFYFLGFLTSSSSSNNNERTLRDNNNNGNDNDNGLPGIQEYWKDHYHKFDKEMQQILDANYNLIDIEVTPNFIHQNHAGDDDHEDIPTDDDGLLGTYSYSGIIGTFCPLNFNVHKKAPSKAPMFRDIVEASPACENPFRTDLQFITDEARLYDAIIQNSGSVGGKRGTLVNRDLNNEKVVTELPKVLNFTGVVFHESRCGSTLVANSLIAMDPIKHRVYSESAPPIHALMMCGNNYQKCSKEIAARVLQDVIYMMSRSNDPKEERVFFKIQSAGSFNIPVFRSASPTTPWIFVYREPVQVIMSHYNRGIKNAGCLRTKRQPMIYTSNVISKYSTTAETTARSLSKHEFCAAYLASLNEMALNEIEESNGMGRSINYVDLPHILYQKVLPDLWGVPMDDTKQQNIIDISGIYSKELYHNKHEWKDDTEKKEEIATPEIRAAAEIYMKPSFMELEKFKAIAS